MPLLRECTHLTILIWVRIIHLTESSIISVNIRISASAINLIVNCLRGMLFELCFGNIVIVNRMESTSGLISRILEHHFILSKIN